MNSKQRNGWLIIWLAIIILSSLACNLPGRNAPEATELPPIPITTEAVESLQAELDAAQEAFRNNQKVEIQISEAQLTSLATFELQSNPDIPLTDPQIYLREGQVQLLASLTQNQIAVPVEIVLQLRVDGQGNLLYEVIQAQLGPLPVPDSLLGELTTQLDQIIDEIISLEGNPLFVESLSIADGILTLRGYPR